MGFNTVVFILNDDLSQIANDKDFGEKIARIAGSGYPGVIPGNYQAEVVSIEHADTISCLLVGGNQAARVGSQHLPRGYIKNLGDQLKTLSEILKPYGYRITKQPVRKTGKGRRKIKSHA